MLGRSLLSVSYTHLAMAIKATVPGKLLFHISHIGFKRAMLNVDMTGTTYDYDSEGNLILSLIHIF